MTNESVLSGDYEARFIQPYQATKRYVCPSCNRDIEAGTGHYVVIPREAPDLRRHWHRGCWERHLNPRTKKRRGSIGLLLILFATGLAVAGTAQPAHACSCVTLRPAPTDSFVGRVVAKNGDSFTFGEIREATSPALPTQFTVMARRTPDSDGRRRVTSCDLAIDQPLLGGVYRVSVAPDQQSFNTCTSGSYTLLEPPPAAPAPAAIGGRVGTAFVWWPWAMLFGALAAGAGAGFALRRRSRSR